MARRTPLHRWPAIAAAVLLVATAAIHAAGYVSVSAAVGASGINAVLAPALRALWLMYAFHLAILGIVVVLASGAAGGRRIVLACALIPAADTVILIRFVGVFAGSLGLAGATVLLVLSGLLHPGTPKKDDGRP